jgi:hypothetical protein
LRSLPCSAAEERLDADEENAEVEGLGEIVVRAGFKTLEDIFRAGACCEHEHGSVTLGFAECANDLEAIFAGEHTVEDDSVDRLRGIEEPSEPGVAVGLVVGAVAFGLEIEEKALREVLFVFDDGDERSFVHSVHQVHSPDIMLTSTDGRAVL